MTTNLENIVRRIIRSITPQVLKMVEKAVTEVIANAGMVTKEEMETKMGELATENNDRCDLIEKTAQAKVQKIQ